MSILYFTFFGFDGDDESLIGELALLGLMPKPSWLVSMFMYYWSMSMLPIASTAGTPVGVLPRLWLLLPFSTIVAVTANF